MIKVFNLLFSISVQLKCINLFFFHFLMINVKIIIYLINNCSIYLFHSLHQQVNKVLSNLLNSSINDIYLSNILVFSKPNSYFFNIIYCFLLLYYNNTLSINYIVSLVIQSASYSQLPIVIYYYHVLITTISS